MGEWMGWGREFVKRSVGSLMDGKLDAPHWTYSSAID